MAGLQDYLNQGFDPQRFAELAARFPVAEATPPTQNSWVGGGLNAGIRELRGAGGSAAEAVGKLTGLTGLEQWGAAVAKSNFDRAQAVGRPDLDVAPWREGGASVLPWLTYQAAKAVPTLALGVAGGMAIPAAAVPAAAARLGAMAPAWLGGGSQAGGAALARGLLGMTAATYAPTAGSIYEQAKKSAEAQGEEVGAGTAAGALAAGLPSAMIGALPLQNLKAIIGRPVGEVAGSVVRRMAAAGVEGAITQVPAEGAQAAIEMAFRPDLTLAQKSQQVVDAALTGAAVGGVFGAGAGGLRRRNPASVSTDELSASVDQQLALPAPEPQKLLTGPDTPTTPALPEARGEVLTPPVLASPALPEARGDVVVTPPPPGMDSVLALPEPARPYQSELPLGLNDQLAPAPPDLAERPLRTRPQAELERVIANADYKRAVAQLDPAETAAYQAAVGELQARSQTRDFLPNAEGDPVRATQRSLPLRGGASYPDPLTAPEPRPQPTVRETPQEMISRVVGVRQLPAPVRNASDLATALDLIEQAASKRNAPKWALDAAEAVGLDGTLDDRIAAAQAKVADIRSRWLGEAAVDPAKTLDATEAQRELTLLQTRKAAIEEMRARRPTTELDVAFNQAPPPAPDTSGFLLRPPTTEMFVPLADAPFQQALSHAQRRLGPIAAASLRVVQSVSDLPENVRAAALERGIPESSIRGTYFDGQGWLVRDNIRDAGDVQEVALHEVFGHKGARTLLGDGAQDKMVGLFDKAGGLAGIMRIAKRFDAETALREYVPSGDLTAADKARVFDEMLAQATGKADGTLKLTALAWAGQIKQQMIKFLDGIGMTALARRMDGFTALDTAVMLRNMRKAVQAGYEAGPDSDVSFSKAAQARDPVDTNNAFSTAVRAVASQAANYVPTTLKDTANSVARRAMMYTASPVHLDRTYGRLFKRDANGVTGFGRIIQSMTTEHSEQQQLNTLHEQTLNTVQALEPKVGRRVRDVLNELSYFGLTPGKDWAAHSDLHTLPNANVLRNKLSTLNKEWASLRQIKGVGEVIDNLVSQARGQRYLELDTILKKSMQMDERVPHEAMPSFQRDLLNDLKAEGLTGKSLVEIETRAREALDATLRDAAQYVTSVRTDLATTLSDTQAQQIKDGKAVDYTSAQLRQLDQIAPLEAMITNIRQSIGKIATAPYVHLGRSGDFFAGAKIAGVTDKSGKVTQADLKSVDAIANMLAKDGHENVLMVRGSDNPGLFIRVETRSQAEAVRATLRKLEAQGHLQKGSVFAGAGAEHEVDSGMSQMAPHYTERVLAAMKERPEFKTIEGADAEQTAKLTAARDEIFRNFRLASMELMPAESFGKLTAQRRGIHGIDGDFVRNQAKRSRAGVNHLVNLRHAPEIFHELGQLHKEVTDAQRAGTAPISDLADMKAVYNEFFRRQIEPVPTGGNQWADIARGGTHAMLTAGSPAYGAIQVLSLGVLGLPELGKRYGYMPSAKAMASTAPVAFRVLREAIAAGWDRRGLPGAVDMMITPEVLAKAKVPKQVADFVMRQINMGALEIGSQSRELGMLADADVPSAVKRGAQYANVIGYGSEAFTKLVMALSTQKLAPKDPRLDSIAYDVQQNSTFNFAPSNASRMLDSKRGILGPATGLASVFLKFQAMLLEKLYSEFGHAFMGRAENAAQRSEARKFLAGHAAAVMVLGGTLALPLVSVVARLADKVVDMTGEEGDEPYDVKSAWRNWLVEIFGKDVGEVAARGLPRAVGVDISQRIGEQDILPFSKFLADRRAADEAIEDLALRAEGAGVSTLINMWTGMNDIFNHGDVLSGMTKMLPIGLRNPLLAYKLGEQGYVNTKGAPLPVTAPSARSIAVQALGFAPSELSEYREARQAQITRKTDMETTAGLIRKRIATAFEQGDRSAAQEAIRQLQVFDAKNPAYAVGPGLAAYMTQRRMAPAVARGLGVPLGVNIRDQGARELTPWANY